MPLVMWKSAAIPRAGRVSFWHRASPDWDSFICGYQGGTRTACFDAETAKTLYKQGRVVGFEVSTNDRSYEARDCQYLERQQGWHEGLRHSLWRRANPAAVIACQNS